MSLEKSATINTAQDLFEFLQSIPEAQRERLPVACWEDGDDELDVGEVVVTAYEVTETEGCIERCLIINYGTP